MNKKILLMVLRVLSITKGTTGAEDFQPQYEFLAPAPAPVEFVLTANPSNELSFAR